MHQKYFAAHRLSGYEFQNHPLPEITNIPGRENEAAIARPNATEAYLVGVISQVVRTRNFRPLFNMLEFVNDKYILCIIGAFVLIDVSYLRGTGDFNILRNLMIERLRQSRYARCQKEIDARMDPAFAGHTQLKNDIRADVLVESYLIFCLALFAFLDTKYDYAALLEELMLSTSAGDSRDLLNSAPLNAIVYMQEARILWGITFLAYLTDREFREARQTSRLDKLLLAQVGRLSSWLTRELAYDAENEQEIRAAMSNLDGLRSELGEYTLQRYHEMIRLLHKQLILQPPQHNPARTTLYSIRDELINQFDRRKMRTGSISIIGAADQREVQGQIEQGWFQLSVLEGIGRAGANLFPSTELAISAVAPERFLPSYQSSFRARKKAESFSGRCYTAVRNSS